MAKEIATPKVNAGGGFSFEDKTVAYLLACLLDDKPPLDSNLGTIERLDFQVRVDGWHLDDVLITLNANDTRRRCAMSVKSNQQFTKDAAPGEFVTAAWEIFLDPGRMNFDRTHDLLGIATAPLDAEFHSQLHELLSWARVQRSGDLPGRVAEKGYGNKLKRSLLKSFACPAGLAAAQGRTEAGTGEMLKCVQHVTFDFELVPSNDLARAISLCREALRSGELLEAEKLWDALCGIARDNRPASGSIDITRLLDLVRGRFHLKFYPQFGSDWGRIAEFTKDNIVRISDLIGGKAALARGAEETALKSSDSVFTALIGPSGCGKTVLAKKVVQLASENQATFWINAASLDTPDFRAFESNLNLQHSLADLFAACPIASAILVIDGLDRQFNDRVFENAATLVEKLGVTRENSPWRVILPCQPEEWNRVHQLLTKANLRVKWSTFNLPEPLDLEPVWAVFPKLRPLSLRPELRPLLLKLNVLDIVATRIDSFNPDHWTGESDLIEWLWSSEIAKPPHAAPRAAFVNALAQFQGDEMRTETPLGRFSVADQGVVDELVADRICSQREGKIAFHHDRLGDWGRQRVLLSEIDELGKYLENRLLSPSWHPAVRLLGLHLLEQSPDISRWRTLFMKSGSADKAKPTVLQDLLLESVIFAASPDSLLERLLPELIGDAGHWLKRLLGRFRHVATLPNPLVTQRPNISGIEAATYMRIPYWPYWLPILRFLYKHRATLLDIAPHEVSLVVDDWLRWGGRKWPLRREAASMGLAMGRKTLDVLRQTDSYYSNDDDFRSTFRAALAGAQEFPDDVSAFALEAAERTTQGRNRPTQLTVRSRHFVTTTDKYPTPWPDGPLSQVAKAFASEVLESDVLRALILVRPAVAREVLLACLIEEPRIPSPYVDRSSLRREHLNIDHLHNWFPPLYTRGPFLLFLRLSHAEGFEVVLRLVAFAFDRWAEVMRERNQPVPEVTVNLTGAERSLIGGYDAYMAYSDTSQWPSPLVASLMALERWFYEQLDGQKPIDSAIDEILRRITTVAFIGLLNVVGCKQPSLFFGPLRPLLSVAEFHDWEIRRNRQSLRGLAMIGWTQTELARLAREWHDLAHRQKNMHDEAWYLMIRDASTRPYFREIADSWDARRATESDPQMVRFLKQIAPKFRIENCFRQDHPEHGTVIVYEEPEEVRTENEALRQKSADQLSLMQFPYYCADLIENKKPIPDENLESFWSRLQRVAEIRETLPDDDSGIMRIENSVCGGVAVLFTFHRDWLAAHPEKQEWCVQKIGDLLLNPPPPAQFEFNHDNSEWDWRSFCARIVAIVWSEGPQEPGIRQFVASLAASPKYKTVEVLFATASAYREQLGDAFKELQEFIFDWAIERSKRERTQYDETPYQVGPWLEAQIQAFTLGRRPRRAAPYILPPPMDSAPLVAGSDPEQVRFYPEIDLELVKAAYSWLPPLSEARNHQESAEWIAFWKYAQAVSLFVAKKDTLDREKSDAMPYDWDQWVLSRIASLILHLDLPNDRKGFWKPWLDLGSDAHYWVERFIGDYLSAGLVPNDVSPRFIDEWRTMIEYVHSSGIWAEDPDRDRYTDELWVHLMGLHSLFFWTPERTEILAKMHDKYEQWAQEHLSNPESAAAFGMLLTRPAAQRLLSDGIVWLDQANLSLNRSTRYARLADVYASLLASAWVQSSEAIRQEPATFTAFKRILQRLTELQNPIALELADRMRK